MTIRDDADLSITFVYTLPNYLNRRMKKIIIGLLIVSAVAMLAYQYFRNKSEEPSAVDDTKPIVIKGSSDAFNRSYDSLMNAYYSLKDALVASNSPGADSAARLLKLSADSLNISALEGDTSGVIKETALSYTGTISTSADALGQEKDIEEKRKEFEIISDALWSLTRTVQYGGGTVYYQFCPMAFNDKGAYWLSNSRTIRNPYFGDKMLTCGSVADSLTYNDAP